MQSQETRTSANAPQLLVNPTAENLSKLYRNMPEGQRPLRFADTAAVADRYAIPVRTLHNWIGLGLIQAVKIGKKYKVYLPSVNAYLAGCARGQEVI